MVCLERGLFKVRTANGQDEVAIVTPDMLAIDGPDANRAAGCAILGQLLRLLLAYTSGRKYALDICLCPRAGPARPRTV